MSGKRKDSRGRILKTGEGQRKDGFYYYRYSDRDKIRRTVYASSLEDLRDLEQEIQKQTILGNNYFSGNIIVEDALRMFFEEKTGVRATTKISHQWLIDIVSKSSLSKMKLKDVLSQDAKRFIMKLQQQGLSYSSISLAFILIKSFFKKMCQEDIIQKNPFDFVLATVAHKEKKERQALSQEQQDVLMKHLLDNKLTTIGTGIYETFFILLNTGMRIGEFCGLTEDDIDFENNKIKIDHQLQYINSKKRIEKPKTEKGNRYIPMTKQTRQMVASLVNHARETQRDEIIDGYKNFICVSKRGRVLTSMQEDVMFRDIRKEIQIAYPEMKFPNIHPHIMRHTFCTNMVNRGMNPKALQYIMGHSNISITLDIYTHMEYAEAKMQMETAMGENNSTTPFTTPNSRSDKVTYK